MPAFSRKADLVLASTLANGIGFFCKHMGELASMMASVGNPMPGVVSEASHTYFELIALPLEVLDDLLNERLHPAASGAAAVGDTQNEELVLFTKGVEVGKLFEMNIAHRQIRQ